MLTHELEMSTQAFACVSEAIKKGFTLNPTPPKVYVLCSVTYLSQDLVQGE